MTVLTSMASMTSTPKESLQQFGFEDFLPGQEAVISAVLAGRSALAIFPTGQGKSLCYQLPALHLSGLTLVVSPLMALMKDQVDFLVGKGIAAARLDSSLDFNSTLALTKAVVTNHYSVVFRMRDLLKPASFYVVHEAAL